MICKVTKQSSVGVWAKIGSSPYGRGLATALQQGLRPRSFGGAVLVIGTAFAVGVASRPQESLDSLQASAL